MSTEKILEKNWLLNHPIEADLISSVPDSGNPAAIGYSEQVRNSI